MENIRCLIADIPQQVLADIVQSITNECKAAEVVDRINGVENLQLAVKENSIDVVILGMKNNVLPRQCSELMEQFANLMVIGLIDDGRRAAVYLDNIGTKEIVHIISTLGKRAI